MPTRQRHASRLVHQHLVAMRIHGPAHHHTRKDVEHDGQVEPALHRPDGRDIGYPFRIGRRRRKLAVEQVGCHWLLVLAVGRSSAMPAWLRTQSTLTHESSHPLAPARLALGVQDGMDAWTAIHLPIGLIDARDALPQPRVLLAAAAGRAQPPQPGIKPTHRHLQDAAHRLDRILLLVRSNELVLHRDSREKMLTTFFKMSRSCRVMSSSRLSRRSSSSWAVWCPLPGKACSPWSANCLLQ